MKSNLLAAAALLGVLIAGSAGAKTFELPDANPAVTVKLPDSWKPQEVEHGVEATSADGETYVAFETATAKGMESLIDDDIAFLSKSGVMIDRSTQQTKDTTVNGLQTSLLHWKGKDKDGPTAVTLGIFGVSPNLVLLMTIWSSPAGDKAHGGEMDAILASVSPR